MATYPLAYQTAFSSSDIIVIVTCSLLVAAASATLKTLSSVWLRRCLLTDCSSIGLGDGIDSLMNSSFQRFGSIDCRSRWNLISALSLASVTRTMPWSAAHEVTVCLIFEENVRKISFVDSLVLDRMVLRCWLPHSFLNCRYILHLFGICYLCMKYIVVKGLILECLWTRG